MKPILFNTEMVRAILGGRKTTTRRIIKLPKHVKIQENGLYTLFADGTVYEDQRFEEIVDYIRPLYQPSDVLYVRETFYQYGEWYDTEKRIQINGEWETVAKHTFVAKHGFPIYFKNTLPGNVKVKRSYKDGLGYYKRLSIFMPKEAARIFLRVTDIKAERLQDIAEGGAKAEGIKSYWSEPHRDDAPFIGCAKEIGADLCSKRCEAFSQLWDSTIKKSDRDKYGWVANPWVWVISFERCEKPND